MSAPDDLNGFINELEVDTAELEDVLKTVCERNLEDYTSGMSMLDKAKAHAMILYTLNSCIYSALRLAGIATTEHPVMKDISRVRTYMAKIKNAEELHAGRQTQIDKQAAGRFIKHALSGNEAYDEERDRKRPKASANSGDNQGDAIDQYDTGTTNVKKNGELEDKTAQDVDKLLSEFKSAAPAVTANDSDGSGLKAKKKKKKKPAKQISIENSV